MNSKGTYIYKNNSVNLTPGKETICTNIHLIPNKTYLIFFSGSINVNIDSIINVGIQFKNGVTYISGIMNVRTTAIAGGGCTGCVLAHCNSGDGEVELFSYGYFENSCVFTGNLFAIEL